MTDSEIKLKNLLSEIDRKVGRKVSKILVKTAIQNGISIKEIEANHTSYIDKLKDKAKSEFLTLHAEEINALEKAIATEKLAIGQAIRESVEQTKETKETVTEKPKEKTKKQKEQDFIRQKYFVEHIGYKAIASMLGKSERVVRKEVAQMLCDMIA